MVMVIVFTLFPPFDLTRFTNCSSYTYMCLKLLWIKMKVYSLIFCKVANELLLLYSNIER